MLVSSSFGLVYNIFAFSVFTATLSFALATQTCCGETVGREEEVLAAECRDFWQLRMHRSQFEIVVNTLDRYSHLKDIKSNPCWHFKMLPLGFRGNAPEQFTLCRAIIFRCKRAQLCQLTPCSNPKEIQKHCYRRAWSWHTAVLWPNSHCGITSANDPGETVGMAQALGFTFPIRGFQDGKLPVTSHLSPASDHTKPCSICLPRGCGTQAPWAVMRDSGDPAESRSGDSSPGQLCL